MQPKGENTRGMRPFHPVGWKQTDYNQLHRRSKCEFKTGKIASFPHRRHNTWYWCTQVDTEEWNTCVLRNALS
ncbi:hypothetical protein CEXT_773231 [Caerostris extrusa]|uniref:Fibronectin type-II domain-containing protein n=1 Tax=Caerostris extrusa TaxID=172846 RepID=A0AAV4PRW1_CAEEX|nr:hypothetical protein CEXT_773231 [Caerostris extrusa]